jgi:hypothetical protein
VIAAGFDGGAPKPRKMPRTVFAEVTESKPLSTPIATPEETVVSSASFFDSIEISETPAPSPAFASEYEPEIEIDDSPNLPRRPQTADGTFGDDLDIPEFLRG